MAESPKHGAGQKRIQIIAGFLKVTRSIAGGESPFHL